ncbi:MAG: SRPBCC family protein [Cytophagaceae bacterium]|nr:SRPBCC family protein [Cytophagaceae bacterium]MDW8456543.1 SRPBCC family protein [Cytophagaceae bacterium]
MKLYNIRRTQVLPIGIEHAWDFFTSPLNLSKITPPYMNFVITSEDADKKIYPGKIITYKVSPLLGIPLTWVTEITHVKEYEYFVDEQRFGPYAFWHHTHFFKPCAQGVEMTDIVYYAIPYGLIGTLAHQLFVRDQLKHIFDFRREALIQLFRE